MLAYACNIIDDLEYVVLCDERKPKNPDIPYFTYEDFNLNEMNDNECKAEFRFHENDISIPSELTFQNGLKVNAIEAMCVFFEALCWYVDLIPRFSRPQPQLCMIANKMMVIIYQNWNYY